MRGLFLSKKVVFHLPILTHNSLYVRPDPMSITGICIRPTENQHHFTMFPLQEIKWCLWVKLLHQTLVWHAKLQLSMEKQQMWRLAGIRAYESKTFLWEKKVPHYTLSIPRTLVLSSCLKIRIWWILLP